MTTRACPYCSTALASLYGHGDVVAYCKACGWWRVERSGERTFGGSSYGQYSTTTVLGGHALLKSLDLCNIRQPLWEVRRYLLAASERRFSMSPRLFEKTVGDVFSDAGYTATITATSCDGGVDVILCDAGGKTVGVQVKRWRDKIGVAQIRELLGALVLGGYTRGIFVTTSRFTKGAKRAAEVSRETSTPIELIDSERFLEALQISQRPAYETYEDWRTETGPVRLETIRTDGPWYEP